MCFGDSVEFLIETFLLSTHMFWLRNVNNEFSLCTFSPVSCGNQVLSSPHSVTMCHCVVVASSYRKVPITCFG